MVATVVGNVLLATALATAPAVPPVESQVEAGWTTRFTDTGAELAVTGTIKVPALDCDATPSGVVTSIGVVEVPYRFAGGRVYASCAGGEAAYEARMESSTGGSVVVDGRVRAGDRVRVVATWDGSVTRPHVDVQMTSRRWVAGTAFDFVADGFNAAVLRQTPMWTDGEQLPVAPYDVTKITGARVDGAPLGGRPSLTRTALVDDAGDRVITPSRIRAGTSFTLVRR